MSKVIGIDLGTTNSCVSVMEGGDVVVITNREGSRTTPSIVAFSKTGETLVGQMARRQAAKNPTSTIFAVKRLIGRTMDDPEVVRMKSLVPFEIVPRGEGEKQFPCVQVNDQIYSPQEISALILGKLKDVAEEYLGEKVEQAVITVPANFNDSQRQATRDAGRIAGLDVLRVINEPTAASLAYGFGEDKDETIVVYDLGGGTFDISILRLGDGLYEVLSTLGDPFLGGEDFDNIIVEKLIEEFNTANDCDIRKDEAAVYRIKEAAEQAKQELSISNETFVNLPFIAVKGSEPLHLERTIMRVELEDWTRHLVEKTLPMCEQAITDAGLSKDEITKIVLVGGMTRMPLVRQAVSDFFGLPIDTNVNPDEVVSVGASIQAGVLNGEVEEVMLMDVTPLSLGVETAGGVFLPLIPRNSAIPCEASEIFTTSVDYQEMVPVHVLQGESPIAAENHSLARFELWGLPRLLRGMPQIEVTFSIDASGIVSVTAMEKATKHEANVKIEASGGFSEDEINDMINRAEEQREQDQQLHDIIEACNAARSALYLTERSMRELGAYLGEAQKENWLEHINEAKMLLDLDPREIQLEDVQLAKTNLDTIQQLVAEAAYKAMSGEEEPKTE